MAINISQLTDSLNSIILERGISGNLISLIPGEQGEIGDQGIQGDAGTTGNGTTDIGLNLSVGQTAHGLTTGDVVYNNGINWIKALATSNETLGVAIAKYVDDNNVNIIFAGKIDGLTGLLTGNYYFLSSITAGELTINDSNLSNPLLYAISATGGIILPWRPVDKSFEFTDTIVYKDINELKNNTSTPTLDSIIYFNVSTNMTYKYEFGIFYSTGLTSNFKYSLTGPNDSYIVINGMQELGGTSQNFNSRSYSEYTIGGGITGSIILRGTIDCITSGTFGLQWAQQNSNQSSTVVYKGSYLEIYSL